MATIKHILSADGDVIREIYVDDRKHDCLSDILAVNTIQDAEPILAEVQHLRDMHGGRGRSGMKHVGRYPITVAEKMMREGSWNDEAEWRKIVNDPEMRAFRVWTGRV